MATLRGETLRRDPAYPALKDVVIGLTGLGYWVDKDEMLADLLAGVIERRREPAAALLTRLRGEFGRGPASEAVVDAVTVGETFFFRYQAQFDALARIIIPDLMERNRITRRLSVWCAGCSNGAEPYSVAMCLRRQFGAALAGWTVDILGTDISEAALAEARTGEYGAWTIRDLPADVRAECFQLHGDRWRVRRPYREGVRFARHNLVNQPPPGSAFDLILCRNVLMYFAPATRVRVVQALRGALAARGWLMVSHAEVGAPVSEYFDALVLPACTLYRRPEGW